MERVLSRWREKSAVVEVEYDLQCSVLMQRCTLARLCTDVLAGADVKLHSVFEDWAVAARNASRFQASYCSPLTYPVVMLAVLLKYHQLL